MNTIYLDRGVRIDVPSLDAARVHGDEVRHAENLQRAQAGDVAAARKAEEAIDAIALLDFSPAVAARLQMKIRNRTAAATWSHFKFAGDAVEHMDDAHDTLGAV